MRWWCARSATRRRAAAACGRLNNPGSSKSYKCDFCGLEVDRDENAARNMFLEKSRNSPVSGLLVPTSREVFSNGEFVNINLPIVVFVHYMQ